MSADGAPSTANLCDGALAVGVAFRLCTTMRPLLPEWRLAGPARCVRHYGSVDSFLECIARARPGEIMVIDNAARDDEGCIGDLITLEAATAGLGGILVWGRHRDSAELKRIGMPLFSLGACSTGPQRLEARDERAFGSAEIGPDRIDDGDWIAADEDGVVVVSGQDWKRVHRKAIAIRDRESIQAAAVQAGTSLREQLALGDFIARRERDPATTFRDHLRARGGAVEV